MKHRLLILSYIVCEFITYFLLAKNSFAWDQLNTPTNFMSGIETTPWGILAGEKDSRAWAMPYNGVYASTDFGDSWEMIGLGDRGITDIYYFDGNAYVTTYYVIDGIVGLFEYDGDETWTHLGPSFSASTTARNSETIFLGGYAHGLWKSQDEGHTWEQSIGSGWFGTEIRGIATNDETTLVISDKKAYKSDDNGDSWIPVTEAEGEIATSVYIKEQTCAIGTNRNLHISSDGCNNFSTVPFFMNYPIDSVMYFQNSFYVAAKDNSSKKTIFKSKDLVNWENMNTGVSSSYYIDEIVGAYSVDPAIFVIYINLGILRDTVPTSIESNPFLDIPWNYQDVNELTTRITSYFDHMYPLLGYYQHSEPYEASNTTLNFIGDEDIPPQIYYSSHSGTDFSLAYGTPIKAAASGYASYYYCTDCGHSIKIDHGNGYETTYMHLQRDNDLFNTLPKQVNKGDFIGRVGLTGKTTGPHLHFEVMDNDKFPDSRTDPFGWLSMRTSDPWPDYTWNDSQGLHQGTQSKYLWIHPYQEQKELINLAIENIVLDNKEIIIDKSSSDKNITVFMKNSGIFKHADSNLKYIPNTSLTLKAIDALGDEVSEFASPITLKVGLNEDDLSNIVKTSLYIYFWEDILNEWVMIPTALNIINNTLSAETLHFSTFAVFGENIYSSPPITTSEFIGNRDGIWLTEFPIVVLHTDIEGNSNIEYTTYSIDHGITWEEYTGPFILDLRKGIFEFWYKSSDIYGNTEEINVVVLHIDVNGRRNKTLRIRNSEFNLSTE